MKLQHYFLIFSLAMVLMAQFNPQSKKLTDKFFPDKNELPNVTPALLKKDGFTTHEELLNFLNGLCDEFPEHTRVEYIGESKKGLKIPLIRLGAGGDSDKIRVWMQGGLHGDEPASTEALLYLLYDLLHNPENASLFEQIELAIVPMANIDGYLKQTRNNAEDLDLNRDQTKLMAAESVVLKQAFSEFQPHVALDFHEYRPFRRDFAKLGSFGVTGAYDVMFLYSGNLNVPASLRNFTNDVFLNPTRELLDQQQLSHHDYVSTSDHLGEIHFPQGSANARSSATNFALQNTVSTLVEVRGVGLGRTSFKRRIFTGYLVAKSFLDIAKEQADALRKNLAEAASASEPVVVNSKPKVFNGMLDFIDLDKIERMQLEVTFRDAWQSTATLTRSRPKGYYIEAGHESLIRKIEAFGIKAEQLTEAQTVQVEQFVVENCQRAPEKYEKMTQQEVTTTLQQVEKTLPAGAWFVSMQQARHNILPELLEPEAPNSFVSFGLLPVENGQTLPIYRLLHD